jgi:hypothetical protein
MPFPHFGTTETHSQTANVPNAKLSPMPSRGGIIKSSSNTINNLDKNPGELITSLRVGIGGNLVVEGPYGDLMFYLGVGADKTIYGKFAAVLTSGNYEGQTISTTADDICWYGGES